MELKNISLGFALALILMSCAPATKAISTEVTLPTLTIAPTHLATLSLSSYPPCTSTFFTKPASEYVSTPILQHKLSNGLILREYSTNEASIGIREEESGCRYNTWLYSYEETEINLNNLFQVTASPIDNRKEKIVVKHNNEKVFETNVNSSIRSGLLGAWEYDGHWAIEILTDEITFPRIAKSVDIICDGVSLKETKNYREVFAFQLIDNKPLYFFVNQNNIWGINYDNIETKLDYDTPPDIIIHDGADGSIYQYQNMVLFYELKANVPIFVAIGAFNK